MSASYKFNIDKTQRKALAQTIGEFFQIKSEYKMPGSRYVLEGKAEIQLDGTLVMDESVSEEKVQQMLQYLDDQGYQTLSEVDEDEPMQLSISIKDDLTDDAFDRLQTILDVKQEILKHAFNSDGITITREDGKITFDGFPAIDSDHHKAYGDFVTLLIHFAKQASRVNLTEKAVTNEKYSFRNFLIRIGMNGPEFKETRKIMLENLTGSAAFTTEEQAKVHAAKWSARRKANKEDGNDADAE